MDSSHKGPVPCQVFPCYHIIMTQPLEAGSRCLTGRLSTQKVSYVVMFLNRFHHHDVTNTTIFMIIYHKCQCFISSISIMQLRHAMCANRNIYKWPPGLSTGRHNTRNWFNEIAVMLKSESDFLALCMVHGGWWVTGFHTSFFKPWWCHHIKRFLYHWSFARGIHQWQVYFPRQ